MSDKTTNNKKDNHPNGGFPPIQLCKDVSDIKTEKKEFATKKDIVDISKILKTKGKEEPFFDI